MPPFPRELRAAVVALSAKAYGGDAYFRGLLPALERFGRGVRFQVYAKDGMFSVSPGSNVTLEPLSLPPWARGPGRVLWEQAVLPRLLDSGGADVAYCGNNVGVFGCRLPVVVSPQNMEPLAPCLDKVEFRLRLRHALLRRLTLASVRRATRVVAVSRFVRDTLLGFGVSAEKIDLVYHGVDDLEEVGGSAAEPGFAFSASKFVRYANLETLLRGFARMRERGFAGILRFAGGPHDLRYEREIRALARELGLAAHVEFLGYIPRSRLLSLLRACKVFLYASTLEACPFALLEALRQGAAVVATTSPPMPELGGDAALYADPADPVAFGDAAFRLAESESLRRSMQARARERAAEYTWEKSVRALVASLKAAAGPRIPC